MDLSNIIWTSDLVEEWIAMAAKVERVLPPVGPRAIKNHWPIARDFISQLWDELDDDEKRKEPRFQPTNEQITQWEIVVLRWFPLLTDRQDKKILWWRACGMGWVRIGKKLGLNRMTIAKYHAVAIENLVKKLNNYHSKI